MKKKPKADRRKARSKMKNYRDCAFCLGPGGVLRRLERPCCVGCQNLSGHMASSAAEEAARIRAFGRRKS